MDMPKSTTYSLREFHTFKINAGQPSNKSVNFGKEILSYF